ncbi:CidA/LrgA family protein [Aeromonas tecta]|uniref:CidA/LrgA family protein n=1 Tax=Aeromonas tecta TaxID=324617 RepID=UPI000683106C|nr:CidA/LrgA family protein [Aeromonas tecta]
MKTFCLRWLQTISQIVLLAGIWLLADTAVRTFHLPLPANLTGMLLLLVCILLGVVKAQWFSAGARWLLAEMLLFFVPAVVAVVNYQDLLLEDGWRIMLVLVVSTILVLGTTALVVDRVYRFELMLARRSRRHV